MGLPVYFTPLLLVILSGACWFLLKGWETRRQDGLYPQPVTIQARELVSPVPTADSQPAVPANRQFALEQTPAPSRPAAVDPKEAAAVTATEAPAPKRAVANDDTPNAIPFKLQAICYRPTRPSAVVNSKTVFVGDSIANGKVKAIDRQSVTLELGGQIRVLTFQ